MTDAAADTKAYSAQPLENLLKEGNTDQFQADVQAVNSGDLQTRFYTLRDLAKLNKADLKSNPDLPGVTLYGFPEDKDSIAGVDLSTKGDIFGNFWRNHTSVAGIVDPALPVLDPNQIRPPELWSTKEPTAQDLNNILKTGNLEKFQNTIDEQLVPRGRREEALDILRGVETLNEADRTKNKNLPVFRINDQIDGTVETDALDPNKKSGINEYSSSM